MRAQFDISDAIKRLELKAVKRSPLNLRTFNNTEAEYDEEATIRLSLPILRQDKEVYTCSYEFTCLVVQNLSVARSKCKLRHDEISYIIAIRRGQKLVQQWQSILHGFRFDESILPTTLFSSA